VSKIAGDWKFGRVVESKGHVRIIGVVTDQPGRNADAVWLQAQLLLAIGPFGQLIPGLHLLLTFDRRMSYECMNF
jgi:hypothetical protein